MTRRRRVLYSAIVLVAVLALAEGGVRLLGLGAPDPATDPSRGFLPFQTVFVERPGEDGRTRLDTVESRSAMMRRLQFNHQSVTVPKPAGEFRILCLGGSATYGWPYDDRLSFPRLLEAGLASAAPEIPWRVVNLGAPGYGTTRLRLIAPELTRLEPDLVVLTAGNNEALERSFAREVFRRGRLSTRVLTGLARTSRLVSWLVGLSTRAGDRAGGEEDGDSLGVARVDGREREEVVRTFAANVAAMRDRFVEAGSRVYLSTAPVNLRDCPPFERDAPGEPRGPTDPGMLERYAEGERLLRDGRASEAVEVLGGVSASAPGSARARFRYASALEAAGRVVDARRAYAEAADLDPVALRSFTALSETARGLAGGPAVRFVDLRAAMSEAGENGVPGHDLFLDNCHPTAAGAKAIARGIARGMAADGILRGDGWEAAFETGMDRHLDGVALSDRDQVVALSFLLWYYRVPAPDPQRALAIQTRIQQLDPAGHWTSPRFRSSLFR